MRILLIQQKGPTQLIIQESGSNKKFKVSIGSEIKCTCGGGVKEHCVHTVRNLKPPNSQDLHSEQSVQDKRKRTPNLAVKFHRQ